MDCKLSPTLDLRECERERQGPSGFKGVGRLSASMSDTRKQTQTCTYAHSHAYAKCSESVSQMHRDGAKLTQMRYLFSAHKERYCNHPHSHIHTHMTSPWTRYCFSRNPGDQRRTVLAVDVINRSPLIQEEEEEEEKRRSGAERTIRPLQKKVRHPVIHYSVIQRPVPTA